MSKFYHRLKIVKERTSLQFYNTFFVVQFLFKSNFLLLESHTRTVLFRIESQKQRNFLHGKDFLELSSIMGYLLYNPRKYIISFVSPRMPRKLVVAPRTLIWGSDVFINILRVENFEKNCFASEKDKKCQWVCGNWCIIFLLKLNGNWRYYKLT